MKRTILYFILYRLMDIEELAWNIADVVIWPFAKLRRVVAHRISQLPK